ncbi:MAG: hypothetical protein K8R86_12285, partial [Bacteroidales bacterium]|nr:hypothetical protein [Bacteroidales bacterium]
GKEVLLKDYSDPPRIVYAIANTEKEMDRLVTFEQVFQQKPKQSETCASFPGRILYLLQICIFMYLELGALM